MESEKLSRLARLRGQLVQRELPDAQSAALDAMLSAALERASEADAEVVTVATPVSRPRRLKLHTLVSDPGLDSMYGKERAELAISSEGVCYLVYRRSDGGDYAIVWSPATLMPPSTMALLPEELVAAMLDGAGEC